VVALLLGDVETCALSLLEITVKQNDKENGSNPQHNLTKYDDESYAAEGKHEDAKSNSGYGS
jgi:hypothetical protein